MLIWFCGLAVSAMAVEMYHTNRTFTAVGIDVKGTPPLVDMLYTESGKLTDLVKGTNITINTNETCAIEKQAAIPVCYGSAEGAWNAAVAYNGTPSNYYGKIFDNVGWVRGTKSVNGEWGAYLWTLQNRIVFRSSETNWWISPSNGVRVAISNVLVGSLGNYPPMTDTNDIGPSINTNFPDVGEEKTCRVDVTNVFYQLIIPSIWITPRQAYVAVNGSNVEFNVTGTNIPQGVTWSLIPDLSGSGGATIQSNGAWQTEVMPGSVGTNYIVRATSKDNTNFYDQVSLAVVKVELMEVGFSGSGEHSLKKTGSDTWTNDTYVSEGDTTITDPVWKDANLDGDVQDAGDTDDPVCFTRESSPTIQAKFKVSPSLTLTAVPFSATLHAGAVSILNYSANVNISGTEVSVTFTTPDQLPNQVFNGTWTIDFACDIAGLTGIESGSSAHKAFIMYATPKTTYYDISDNYNPVSMALTAKRANIASEWANTEATTNEIATTCDSGVGAKLGFAYNYTNNPFVALDIGGGWDCISWGNIAATACRLLGVEAHPYRAWCHNNIVTTNSSTWGWQIQYHLYHHPDSGEASWFLGYPDNNFQGFFYVGQLDVSAGVFPSDGWSVGHYITAESGKENYLPIYVIQTFAGVGGMLQWKVADLGSGNAPISEWQPNSEISGITIDPFPDSSSPDLADDGTYNINWNVSAYTLQFNNGSNITVTADGNYILPSAVHDIRVIVTTNSLPSTNESGNVRVVPPHYLATIP
ncbi:MAG: hypothetical protein KJ964_01790 [Verrucomicrobia bacterium]|nr:hypothetical protein [Verrucomicrobiota bacterium]MBU1857835.1 hypothetical protein [Verrucomicrobiota bacterium]